MNNFKCLWKFEKELHITFWHVSKYGYCINWIYNLLIINSKQVASCVIWRIQIAGRLLSDFYYFNYYTFLSQQSFTLQSCIFQLNCTLFTDVKNHWNINIDTHSWVSAIHAVVNTVFQKDDALQCCVIQRFNADWVHFVYRYTDHQCFDGWSLWLYNMVLRRC